MKLPKVDSTKRYDLTTGEVKAIAEAIDRRHDPMVWIGAVLGPRLGEAAGLTVGDLSLLWRTITVAHQLNRDGTLGAPKSAAAGA